MKVVTQKTLKSNFQLTHQLGKAWRLKVILRFINEAGWKRPCVQHLFNVVIYVVGKKMDSDLDITAEEEAFSKVTDYHISLATSDFYFIFQTQIFRC